MIYRLLCIALLALPAASSAVRPVPRPRGPYAPLARVLPSQEEVGVHKALRFIRTAARSQRLGPQDSVVATTCRRNIVLSEFLDESELTKKLPPPADLDLNFPVRTPKDAFSAIRATVLGRAIMKKFLPRYGTDIKVEVQPASQIRETQSNALAYYDPLNKIIRIEKDAEIGAVAFVLLHEVVHALDNDYVHSVKKHLAMLTSFAEQVNKLVGDTSIKVRKSRDQLQISDFDPRAIDLLARIYHMLEQIHDIQVFRAERYAYDASYDVWKELAALYPSYYKAKPSRGLAGEARMNLKGEPIFYDDDHIVKINGLDPVFINKFKEGKCIPAATALKELATAGGP